MTRTHIVFDLDDTLYKERDYSLSALKFAGSWLHQNRHSTHNLADALYASFEAGAKDAIGEVLIEKNIPITFKPDLIRAMQSHVPDIKLPSESIDVLQTISRLGLSYSLLTDGRATTQRAKINALGLNEAQSVIISEEIGHRKPDQHGFLAISAQQSDTEQLVYIGDNPKKDFIAPNQLGWVSIMLEDDGRNTHSQNVPDLLFAAPKFKVRALVEIFSVLEF